MVGREVEITLVDWAEQSIPEVAVAVLTDLRPLPSLVNMVTTSEVVLDPAFDDFLKAVIAAFFISLNHRLLVQSLQSMLHSIAVRPEQPPQ